MTLWEHDVRQLVCYARHKLQGARRGIADEKAVALKAVTAFCRAAKEGRRTNLAERDCLWR